MKRILLSISILVVCQIAVAQGSWTLKDKPFVYQVSIDSSIWLRLIATPGFNELSVEEQSVFYWTNLFRKDPSSFFHTVVKEFLRQFPEANSEYVGSLESDVKRMKGALPMVLPEIGLRRMSDAHSADLLKRGSIISHKSALGRDFGQRIREAGNYRCGGENIYVGSFNGLEALIALLVDQGVPDKGHRMNLLDSRFTRMGVSFRLGVKGKSVLVQELACY